MRAAKGSQVYDSAMAVLFSSAAKGNKGRLATLPNDAICLQCHQNGWGAGSDFQCVFISSSEVGGCYVLLCFFSTAGNFWNSYIPAWRGQREAKKQMRSGVAGSTCSVHSFASISHSLYMCDRGAVALLACARAPSVPTQRHRSQCCCHRPALGQMAGLHGVFNRRGTLSKLCNLLPPHMVPRGTVHAHLRLSGYEVQTTKYCGSAHNA